MGDLVRLHLHVFTGIRLKLHTLHTLNMQGGGADGAAARDDDGSRGAREGRGGGVQRRLVERGGHGHGPRRDRLGREVGLALEHVERDLDVDGPRPAGPEKRERVVHGLDRLGDRIRVGGTAELAGYDLTLREARRDTLNHVVTDLFPDSGDVARAEFWTGLRPMTPDGTPIIGPSPLANLYLATGHGTLGWTMAAGTGRVMADLISGRTPEIDLDGLTLARYREY